ncbi:MAG TPA: efflux RND transporter periplasmic adaptor subunit [Hanamia sp.]|nr:efflux RND transporter periplasmic adaptor subunit [Hanamia sp.]
MKKLFKTGVVILLISFISSCGDTGKKDNSLSEKKAQLEKLESQKDKLDNKIADLQKEIGKIDTSSSVLQKPKLVALSSVALVDFKHYLTLQGSVDSKNISYITPSGQPGQIVAIYVKQGEKIHKGQLILKLDDAVQRENVNAIKQQMGSVKAQLELAKSIYQRQKNLWDQQIGTQVQLLQDQTNVETLQNQLKSIQAQVNLAQEQANQSNVYSNVNGTVDDITTHVGETFNGNPLTGGYIRIVNDTNLKISVTIPENYTGQVSKGSKVIVQIPDINKTFESEISFLSQSIETTTRGFTAEIKVPKGMRLRPNEIAIVNILDYNAPNSIAIPVNTLQTGQDGKYVLIAEKKGDEMLAKKVDVVAGQLSGDSIQIEQGLQPGEQLITQGYQGIFDGQPITTK